MFLNALGNMQTSQEHFTTIVYANFWGEVGEANSVNYGKVENREFSFPFLFSYFLFSKAHNLSSDVPTLKSFSASASSSLVGRVVSGSAMGSLV